MPNAACRGHACRECTVAFLGQAALDHDAGLQALRTGGGSKQGTSTALLLRARASCPRSFFGALGENAIALTLALLLTTCTVSALDNETILARLAIFTVSASRLACKTLPVNTGAGPGRVPAHPWLSSSPPRLPQRLALRSLLARWWLCSSSPSSVSSVA